MSQPRASAAVLGTSVALAAAFLAQPAPSRAADRDDARTTAGLSPAHVVYASTAMRALAPRDRTDSVYRGASAVAPGMTLAVCRDCGASQALVRVLLRHHRHGTPLPSFRVYTDRAWPALDSLARHTRSTVVVISDLAIRVGVTPAALRASDRVVTLGVPAVLALITHPSDTTATTSGELP